MVSLGSLKIAFLLVATVLIFFTAGLLSLAPRARRLLGAYRIPWRPAFSSHLIDAQSQTTSASTICTVAPASRSQFMGNNGTTPNVIPTALLSPQALALLQLIPLPNISGITNPAANNFQGNGTAITNSDSFDVRVDLFQSQKIHMFGRYSLQQYQHPRPGAKAPRLAGRR